MVEAKGQVMGAFFFLFYFYFYYLLKSQVVIP